MPSDDNLIARMDSSSYDHRLFDLVPHFKPTCPHASMSQTSIAQIRRNRNNSNIHRPVHDRLGPTERKDDHLVCFVKSQIARRSRQRFAAKTQSNFSIAFTLVTIPVKFECALCVCLGDALAVTLETRNFRAHWGMCIGMTVCRRCILLVKVERVEQIRGNDSCIICNIGVSMPSSAASGAA